MSNKSNVYSLSMLLAASGISDIDLLYIADALYSVENPGNAVAVQALARHKLNHNKATHLAQACKIRNIDVETGTKVITSTVDLLA